MSCIYDVLIVGAGVTGCSIARELSKYDLRTAVIEKEEEPAFGVSKSNSGIIHPGTQNDPDSLKGRLCVRGNMLTRKICRELGVEIKEVGELIVAFDEEEKGQLAKIMEQGRIIGVPGLRIVDAKWIRKNEPDLSEDIIAALSAPTACILSPYRLVYALAENASVNGVDIFCGTEVTAVVKDGPVPGFIVHSGDHAFRSRYLVNAAGLFADRVAEMAGINNFRITPRKGEEFLLDKKKENITARLIFPLPTKKSKGIIVIKTSDGNPMIGPTAEDIEDKYDLATTDEGLEKVLNSAKKMVPSIEASDIIAYFAGLRPVAGKDFIIRHEDAVPGLINVAGIQSPGLTAAPAIAETVISLLSKNGLYLKKKKRFKKRRKRTEHLFDMSFKDIKEAVAKEPEYGDMVCRCENVSKKEIKDAISRGARTLDGIKFRTRAQAGRCHGSFCTSRILGILSEETGRPVTQITKRGKGSEVITRPTREPGDD